MSLLQNTWFLLNILRLMLLNVHLPNYWYFAYQTNAAIRSRFHKLHQNNIGNHNLNNEHIPSILAYQYSSYISHFFGQPCLF